MWCKNVCWGGIARGVSHKGDVCLGMCGVMCGVGMSITRICVGKIFVECTCYGGMGGVEMCEVGIFVMGICGSVT